MRRREFITLISGAAAWPVVARAQRPEQIRRIGVLTQGSINSHPTPQFRAFLNALHEAGWDEGHNLKIEWRFSEGSAESRRVLVIYTPPYGETGADTHASA